MTVSSLPVAVTKQEESSPILLEDNIMSLTYAEFISPVESLDVQYLQGSYSASYLNEATFVPFNLPQEFQVMEETHVPLMQNSEDSEHDFIVIAEFSELEGPVPLCTIPFNAPSKTDINLSSLAVHLMSTDYQVNTVGHFKICQDTQVMRTNIFKNVHVFMQYFTLYDIKARGFVRPFCFGYVSKDHVKLNKLINVLITEFDRYAQILKQVNRQWFANELIQYLEKLSSAKENFLQDFVPKDEDVDPDVFSFEVGEGQEDPDAITLNQIAHQYSEIENILRTVIAADQSSASESEIEEVCALFDSNPNAPIVAKLLDKMKIPISPNGISAVNNSGSIDIPLLHPLKTKGESLRPLTTLGQLGTVVLIWKLMAVHKQSHRDLIFTEMDALTADFRKSCQMMNQNSNVNSKPTAPVINSNYLSDFPKLSSSLYSHILEENENCENIEDCKEGGSSNSLFTEELCCIIDKLHSNIPVVSDSGSGSYHTISEDDSDLNVPSRESGNENESSCYTSAFGSVENCTATTENTVANCPSLSSSKTELRSPKTSISSDSTMQMSRVSVSSFSSDEEIACPSTYTTLQLSSEEVLVKKVPWWETASENLTRGRPGYGLLKFFRRYYNVAHHILFSILIGRPIVICSEEKNRSKVAAILTALTPLVPCYPDSHWKLLRWHRGILVQTHIRNYKLIGLCIPERLNVLDLLHPKDQNFVTIFNIDRRNILGPAYQGNFFQNFENMEQNRWHESDVGLLTYIGSILTEIESKVFMFKTLEGRNISTYFKQLNLRSSDIEIVRCLGNMVADADHSVELF